MSHTKAKVRASAEAVRKAEEQLAEAKQAHVEAFKVALVALFNEYGLAVESVSYGGLEIVESESGRVYTLDDLGVQ